MPEQSPPAQRWGWGHEGHLSGCGLINCAGLTAEEAVLLADESTATME